MKPYHLGIVTAMRWETELAEQACYQSSVHPNTVSIICSGIGAEAAKAAALQLIENGADALISLGCCGGLNPAYNSGDIIIAHSAAINATTNKLIADSNIKWQTMCLNQCENLKPAIKVNAGTIANAEKALESKQQKQKLYTQSKADIVDMESAAVIAVGRQNGIPTLAIRGILDTATETLPAAFTNSCDAFGNVKWATLFVHLLKQPQALKYANRLAKQQRLVKQNLDVVIQALQQQAWLLTTQPETNHA